MKLKLIHTENNSFIVDVEAEPELKKDWCIDEINRPVNLWFYPEKLKGKILYSLNKISDDIPLFEIVEDDKEIIKECISCGDIFKWKSNKEQTATNCINCGGILQLRNDLLVDDDVEKLADEILNEIK